MRDKKTCAVGCVLVRARHTQAMGVAMYGHARDDGSPESAIYMNGRAWPSSASCGALAWVLCGDSGDIHVFVSQGGPLPLYA